MRFIDFVFFALWVAVSIVGLVFPSVAFSALWAPPDFRLDTFYLDKRTHREEGSRFSGRLVSSTGERLLRFKGARTLLGDRRLGLIMHEIDWTSEPGFRDFLIEGLHVLAARLPEAAEAEQPGKQVQWSGIKSSLLNLDSELSSDRVIVAELHLVFGMLLDISKQAYEPVVPGVAYFHRLLALWLGGFTSNDLFHVSRSDLETNVPPLEIPLFSLEANGEGFRSGRVQFILRSQGAEQWLSILRREHALRKSLQPFVGTTAPVCTEALLSVGASLYPDFSGFWKWLRRFP
jgi:hypothetical protein